MDNRTQKEIEVKELVQKMTNSTSFITFDYQGLTAQEFNNLRIALRKNGCDCKVYKNNIARRAAEICKHPDWASTLIGPKAILFGKDAIVPAKTIMDYSKTVEKVKVYGGVVDGVTYNALQIKELANLPSYETLLTMLAGAMLAPVRELAVGLNMIVEKQA